MKLSHYFGKDMVIIVDKSSKKDMIGQYKSRAVTGAVFCIRCNASGREWMKSTKDLAGQINKFNFFVSTNSCPEPGMASDWNQYGANSFSLSVLVQLDKGETQTDREFADDIRTLYELWLEKKQGLT